MKTCPGCSFLIDDGLTWCTSCRPPDASQFPIDDVPIDPPPRPAASGGSSGSLLLLERDAVSVVQDDLRYRGAGLSRELVRTLAILALALGALGVFGSMALRGEGPLASTAVSLGLADPPDVEVPSAWSRTTVDEAAFDAELPVGSTEYERSVVAGADDLGVYRGRRVALGDAGEMLVMSTDLGPANARLRLADEAAFESIVDEVIARGDIGDEAVRRDVVVGTGRAVDSVLVEGHDSTARVRFVHAGGRLHLLVTRGPDNATRLLDDAHARLIAGFEPAV